MRDWREISLRVLIDAPLDMAFRHWTEAALLGKWFVLAAHQTPSGSLLAEGKSVFEGCRYRWTWANGVAEEGEFTQVETDSLLAFTFGNQVDVVVLFGQLDGRTLIELRQTHGQEDREERASWFADCTQGWTFFLTNLKSVLEGGLDLREMRQPDISNVNV